MTKGGCLGTIWTSGRVQELAPDEASLKAAKGLANPGKWSATGSTERAAWGECQGSGNKPYQTRIDLDGPAFKCSCPSRKFPCKHSLALFLLYTDHPALFTGNSPPGWVSEWIDSRNLQAQKKSQVSTKAETSPDPEAQAKRAAQRQDKILSGLEELTLWLCDLLRQGLAWAHSQPPSYWNSMAARLVDAQAVGLSNRVKRMAETILSGQDWQERLIRQVAHTYLLIEAYKRLDGFDENLRQEVRALVGWTVSKEQLLEQEMLWDRWHVLSQRVEHQDTLDIQRTWLWGPNIQRFALVLDFAANHTTLDKSLLTGTVLEAGLVFYPGVDSHRALIKERRGLTGQMEKINVTLSASELFTLYADRLEKMPWTETIPCFLGPIQILPAKSIDGTVTGWYGADAFGRRVMLSPKFRQGWHTLAVSGGKPLTLFGEWDGRMFLPLSLDFNGRVYQLTESPVYGLQGIG
jgi:hypothetical protein